MGERRLAKSEVAGSKPAYRTPAMTRGTKGSSRRTSLWGLSARFVIEWTRFDSAVRHWGEAQLVVRRALDAEAEGSTPSSPTTVRHNRKCGHSEVRTVGALRK